MRSGLGNNDRGSRPKARPYTKLSNFLAKRSKQNPSGLSNKVQVDGKVDINLGQQRLGKKVLELKHASLNLDDKIQVVCRFI